MWIIELPENKKKHIILLETKEVLDKKAFFADLASHIKNSSEKKVFVFIHGYCVTFEDAARRTAQMARDLNFDKLMILPIFYSWPSRGKGRQYPADEEAISRTKKNLKEFLNAVATQSDANAIYLIAHSMGSRALTEPLVELQKELPSEKRSIFREIILVAPDIDAAEFKDDIAPQMISHSPKVTLYASAKDLLLKLSMKFHDNPRAGYIINDKPIILDGMETIDVTNMDTSFLGHSYYAENESVLSDIYYLLKGQRANERYRLYPKGSPPDIYWQFRE